MYLSGYNKEMDKLQQPRALAYQPQLVMLGGVLECGQISSGQIQKNKAVRQTLMKFIDGQL